MLIYILDAVTYDRIAVIEEYESCIWTERYIDPGDFTLVVPELGTNVHLLRAGRVLENEEGDRPMIVEGIELKDGTITFTGRTLETFFNQRSFTPRDSFSWGTLAPDEYNTIGNLLADFIEEMQDPFWVGGLTWPGPAISWYSLDQAIGDGREVNGRITKEEKVHDVLLRLAKQYNVDMFLKRIADDDSYIFAFGTRDPVDRTSSNSAGNSVVRFSADDDNLIDVHEIYDATADFAAVVVRVPRHFTGPGHIGNSLPPVIYAHTGGVDTFIDYLDDLNLPTFETRVIEVNADVLTLDFLKTQYWRYYTGPPTTWAALTFDQKKLVLIGEMQRLAVSEFHKAKRTRKHVIDGEVASSFYRYGIDYKLGDRVEVAGALNLIPAPREKYPRVSGANTADRNTGLVLMRSIWDAARPYFPTSQVAMPRVLFVGPPDDLFVGTVYDAGSSSPSRLQVIWPDWMNAWFIGHGTEAERHSAYDVLIHEWAHYFQLAGVFKDTRAWVAEGGAQAFTRRVAPDIYGTMGITYVNEAYGVDQYTSIDDGTSSGNAHGATGRVELEFPEYWITTGQFRSLGTDDSADNSINQKIVTEFIRSLDESGYRAYPTLAPPPEQDLYFDDPHQANYPEARYEDHTFSINGLLGSDLQPLSPHKVFVSWGEIKQLVKFSQTGPAVGTCTLKLLVNGSEVNPFNLPITLADGDFISVDPRTHSSNAETVSGHFTIRIIDRNE